MAEENIFYGHWKVSDCVSLTEKEDSTALGGTSFCLDETGDVQWNIPEGVEQMPFFSCETFEVSLFSGHVYLKFFGSFSGHVMEFKAEVSENNLLLTYDKCCMLICQRVVITDVVDDTPFSFITALEEGFFTDMNLTAVDKKGKAKQIAVQKTILSLAIPECDWTLPPTGLHCLPEDVLLAILHYLYAGCLPNGLSEETARACVQATKKLKGFESFVQRCETFLKNAALKQQIETLIEDMHSCGERIIDLFSGKVIGPDGLGGTFDSIVTNPAKLCYVIEQALKETAIAGAKFVILCDLFTRRKGELSREERHEIIKYAKSRLPVFMGQMRRLLEVCKQHCTSINPSQRHEIATYLVPEIEASMETISTFVVQIKTALEAVINTSSSAPEKREERGERHRVGDMLGKSLRNALHMRELMKMRKFHDKMSHSFQNLMQKKDHFHTLSQDEKIRSVSKSLEQLIEEVPLFLTRIEELMTTLDDKLTWREWKYLFKLSTSKVAWILGKSQQHRESLQSLTTKASDIVQRESFNQCLTSLGIWEPATVSQASSAASARVQLVTKYAQLSSIESLCKSPVAKDSVLAKRALELLEKGIGPDMEFELYPGAPLDGGDAAEKPEIVRFPAHRVIVAARCDWFRRALLSGMRESIEKRITVHDTPPRLFDLFLRYLYGGHLQLNDLSVLELADMLAIADRYEVDALKHLCERCLATRADDENALYMLGLADQFNAVQLKEHILKYVHDHPALANSDVFDDLPLHLQSEVESSIDGHGFADQPPCNSRTPSSRSSVSEAEDLVVGLDLRNQQRTASSSSDEFDLVMEEDRLRECITELMGIVGDDVPRSDLVRVALAADYDVNRALNFFFSSL